MAGAVVKRSLTLKGHRTSLAIEPPFWAQLEALARDEQVALAALVQRIDAARAEFDDPPSLAAAVRLHVLQALDARGGP